jgi:hypothetical protein
VRLSFIGDFGSSKLTSIFEVIAKMYVALFLDRYRSQSNLVKSHDTEALLDVTLTRAS